MVKRLHCPDPSPKGVDAAVAVWTPALCCAVPVTDSVCGSVLKSRLALGGTGRGATFRVRAHACLKQEPREERSSALSVA